MRAAKISSAIIARREAVEKSSLAASARTARGRRNKTISNVCWRRGDVAARCRTVRVHARIDRDHVAAGDGDQFRDFGGNGKFADVRVEVELSELISVLDCVVGVPHCGGELERDSFFFGCEGFVQTLRG